MKGYSIQLRTAQSLSIPFRIIPDYSVPFYTITINYLILGTVTFYARCSRTEIFSCNLETISPCVESNKTQGPALQRRAQVDFLIDFLTAMYITTKKTESSDREQEDEDERPAVTVGDVKLVVALKLADVLDWILGREGILDFVEQLVQGFPGLF